MPKLNKGLSIFFAIQFVRWLVKPFNTWDMYNAGLIDGEGKVLREPKSNDEKKMFNSFSNLVRNLKILLAKIPGGKSKIGAAISAAALLKEEQDIDLEVVAQLLKEAYPNDNYIIEESQCKHNLSKIFDTIYNQMYGKTIIKINPKKIENLYFDDIYVQKVTDKNNKNWYL